MSSGGGGNGNGGGGPPGGGATAHGSGRDVGTGGQGPAGQDSRADQGMTYTPATSQADIAGPVHTARDDETRGDAQIAERIAAENRAATIIDTDGRSAALREQAGAGIAPETDFQLGNVDAENEYLAPDKEHWNQTQKEINTKIKEAKADDRYDVSLTKEQSTQYQKDMNEYYGTEGKKYQEYGRAGEGTVNLTFQEHWDNAPILHPALKYSPSARFLYVTGKQAQEALTSDYGTYRYGAQPGTGSGPAVDQGGILGRIIGGGTGTPSQGVTVSGGESNPSSQTANTFLTTGNTQPSSSVAGNWYQSLGGTKAFNLATEYAAAKAAVQNRLGTPSPYGWLAVNESPFYNWLKTNSLDKGIL